ncbi:hypothetical protein LCU15_000346 [Salmonella enterica]|uniref:Uncharacterized protein n=1 Tax=Salmonella newport TaxID=108619 RepID=A0A5Z7Y1I2_SALNE|nr:hypothetical protein [Salmonella enterica]ECS7536485.1 hypothetical protein [Salmonella enterica subsp. enterica serovar Newport]EAV5255447.1 hypothetical protein [Salmonella enterica]EAW5052829.1 hypothetical protein [Salmonella enterica]EBD6866726.1 hypothetical protein [Salmonella enterica]
MTDSALIKTRRTPTQQAQRDEFAQDGQWLLAMEFLIVCSRTIDSLKRVVREVRINGNTDGNTEEE